MLNKARKYFFPSFIAFLMLLSCTRSPLPQAEAGNTEENNLSNSIVGYWKSDALVVMIDTIHNSETSVVLNVTKDEWVEKTNLQPIQTIFNKNKTYVSAYASADGKIIRMTAGKWEAGKNQLRIHQLFPSDKQMNYRIDLNDGFAELRSRMDFDGDGKNDDVFYCQMKKVS